MTIARAQMAVAGSMPSCKGLDQSLVHEMRLCYIDYLITNKRDLEAEQVIEEFIYDDDIMQQLPELYAAWLWLARMALLIARSWRVRPSVSRMSSHCWPFSM